MPAQPQASRESHTPKLYLVGYSMDNTDLLDAECSCARWSVKCAERWFIREQHDAHVQKMLGPDREGGERG